jgi:preprotein translocase subunit SecG
MIFFLTVVHVIVCLFLILVVLLQQGKGQDFASTFGGGGTQTAFGSRGGATALSKLTTLAAALFMMTSMALTIMMSRSDVESVIDPNAVNVPPPIQEPAQEPATIPAAPADGTDGGLAPGAGEVAPEVEGAPEAEN